MNKVVRSYRLSRDVLYCRVDFLPDSADFVDENHWSASGPEYRFVVLSAIVGPSANRTHDLKVYSMNCPRSLVFEETVTFCQTIQQMYQL